MTPTPATTTPATTPPATAPAATAAGARPLRRPAVVASLLVSLAALGPVAMAASTATFGHSQRTATAQTGMGLLSGGYLVAGISFPLAAVAVVVWLRRARTNAEALSPAPHRLGAGWAIGGWFVPVAAYVVPFMVTADVVRAGAPAGQRPSTALVVWWAAWITAHLALLSTLLVPVAAVLSGAPVRVPLLAAALIAQGVLHVVAAAAFSRLALRLAAQQDAQIRG